ncbi:hypothetical protein RB195_025960 [Necator americanus]|uniref:Uncharacterized protein n=1 Tax=Necator americanus TaxID=51031 RepID=A0ABR1EUQ1_NECAM
MMAYCKLIAGGFIDPLSLVHVLFVPWIPWTHRNLLFNQDFGVPLRVYVQPDLSFLRRNRASSDTFSQDLVVPRHVQTGPFMFEDENCMEV